MKVNDFPMAKVLLAISKDTENLKKERFQKKILRKIRRAGNQGYTAIYFSDRELNLKTRIFLETRGYGIVIQDRTPGDHYDSTIISWK